METQPPEELEAHDDEYFDEDPYYDETDTEEIDDTDEVDEPAHGWQRRRVYRVLIVVLAALAAVVLILIIPPDEANTPVDTTTSTPVVTPSNWPTQLVPTDHTIPAMIKNALTQPGNQHGYRFQGNAGNVWYITVEPRTDSDLDPILTLYGPSGEIVGSHDDRSADDLTAELTIELREDGSYWLLVESSQSGLTTGAYLLTLWEQ